MSSVTVVAAVLGTILGVLVMAVVLALLMLCYCCVFSIQDKSYNVSDVSYTLKSPKQTMLDSLGFSLNTGRKQDLERGTERPELSDVETKPSECGTDSPPRATDSDCLSRCCFKPDPNEKPAKTPLDETTNASDTKPDASSSRSFPKGHPRNSTDSLDVFEDFDKLTVGMQSAKESIQEEIPDPPYRYGSIKLIKTQSRNLLEPQPANEAERAYLTDQYDSYSRTLMLQHLLRDSINGKAGSIKEVRDPYSDSMIRIGMVVVVVKPFHGEDSHEFASLQPGDLLRIITFYIKESTDETPKKLLMAPRGLRDLIATIRQDQAVIDKDDTNYDSVYCTAVMLNTHLEYNAQNNNLALCMKDENPAESELLLDLPLNTVSLETTVLKAMFDESTGKTLVES